MKKKIITLQPEDICPKSKNKKHVPDWSTVSVDFDGEVYIDINCKLCGRSGCVGNEKTLKENIQW